METDDYPWLTLPDHWIRFLEETAVSVAGKKGHAGMIRKVKALKEATEKRHKKDAATVGE